MEAEIQIELSYSKSKDANCSNGPSGPTGETEGYHESRSTLRTAAILLALGVSGTIF